MVSSDLDQLVITAGQFHGAGKLAEAESLYRKVLAADPSRSDAMCGLGLIASQTGRHDEALRLLRWEVVSCARNPLLLAALSVSLLAVGGAKGAQGALTCSRRGIELDPEFADSYNNLGCALQNLGQLSEAADAFRAAIAKRADYPEAHFNLGRTLFDAGDFAGAAAAYRAAIGQRPAYAGAFFNLGFALRKAGDLDGAAGAFRQALALQPPFPEALHNLAVTLAEKGQVREAAAMLREAIALAPGNMQAHSALMYLLQFHPDCSSEDIALEAARWDDRHAAVLRPAAALYSNNRDPDRRLRIGYVSPDFYAHAQCRFMLPLLAAHDHRRFEIHCYSSVRRPDQITQAMRRQADVWHEALPLSDAALADRIRLDEIDILVDLSMHMENHRLLTFARRPAPVQFTWLAYPTCPGLSAIDYRVTDAFLDPPERPDAGFPELPLYIPTLNCCYDPVTATPEVGPLPALAAGRISFGSLNNFRKMSPEVLALWAETLRAVPGSTLTMLCPPGDHRPGVLRVFQERGVDGGRITLLTHLSGPAYLAAYHAFDIALDPFPYNGITTTLDALYMGVPVLTLPGRTAPSRASQAILSALEMTDWVAASPEDFVEKAAAAAKDVARLAALRSGLRNRMRASSIMDGRGFAARLEAAYRLTWQNWARHG